MTDLTREHLKDFVLFEASIYLGLGIIARVMDALERALG